jgi:hypothetical protein
MTGAKRTIDPMLLAGALVTAVVHLGVLGVMLLARAHARSEPRIGPGTFVDAQLVRFGRPRDLSFLPHKQGPVRRTGPAEQIKVARDDKALPRLDKPDKPPDVIDPLKKTHAEMFKNLPDDDRPPAVAEDGVGSLSGSRAGTATEARGDPYILSLIDQIGSAWAVPTTIRDAELAQLSAEVCLTISPSGALTRYRFVRKSGNSQFDSSLEATLGTIKTFREQPPDRFREAAARGNLCPTFSKQ